MTRLHRLMPLAAALLSLPVIGVGSRPAAALSCGILPYTEMAVNRRFQTTESREFVDVVGSSLRFRTREMTCIVVQFSAQITADGDGSVMQVRAVRNDGKQDVVNVEGPVQFVAGRMSDGRSYGLLLPAVAPGVHTVRLQYRAVGDGSVTIQRFSMNVSRGQ
jgi:hypothetical protein